MAAVPEPVATEPDSTPTPPASLELTPARADDVETPSATGGEGKLVEPKLVPNAVTWALDGFLHKLVRVNTLMERHGGEIAELLANRISLGPDIAIVRAALAHLGELERRFGELECGAGRGDQHQHPHRH